MDRTEQRRRTVAEAVADIRAIEAREGVTREGLARVIRAARHSIGFRKMQTTALRSMPMPRMAATARLRTTTPPGP